MMYSGTSLCGSSTKGLLYNAGVYVEDVKHTFAKESVAMFALSASRAALNGQAGRGLSAGAVQVPRMGGAAPRRDPRAGRGRAQEAARPMKSASRGRLPGGRF